MTEDPRIEAVARQAQALELAESILESIEKELDVRRQHAEAQITNYALQGRADRAGGYAIWLEAIESNRGLIRAMFQKGIKDTGLD